MRLVIKLIFYSAALSWHQRLKSDMHNYIRKLRLTEFCCNASGSSFKQSGFTTKSTSTLPKNRDREVDNQTDILHNLDLEWMETLKPR